MVLSLGKALGTWALARREESHPLMTVGFVCFPIILIVMSFFNIYTFH